MTRRQSRKQRNTAGAILTAIIIIAILAAIVFGAIYLQRALRADNKPAEQPQQTEEPTAEPQTQQPASDTEPESPYYTTSTDAPQFSEPTATYAITQPSVSSSNTVVEHKSFTLSYSDEHKQAEWVYYLLTQEMVSGSEGRSNNFKADPVLGDERSAHPSDYTRTGYDRGHLCPSADVRNDKEAQYQTFYMSNMSPQAPAFNRGIWKRLEEQVRSFVMKHDSIYVVTGPVLTADLQQIDNDTDISVPEYFYKVIYSPADGGQMIAYLLPNRKCDGDADDYIVTVDSIETLTSIDFFPQIENEETLESIKSDATWWH